ncbi:MAG: hypothetical protein HYY78_11350 [Betaproteobacteria bacterium]|nr:hypothetical protein [Betaproteobacteria bacterium]
MAYTMAENLLTRRILAGKPVRAGDFLEARIDGWMCHYHANDSLYEMAVQGGFKDRLRGARANRYGQGTV